MTQPQGLHHNWRAGLGFALTTTLLWALLPLALKGLLTTMDVWTITWYRFIASAVIGMLWYGRESIQPIRTMLSPRHRLITAIAVFGLLGNYGAYLIGLKATTASSATVMIQLAPLSLLLGSVFIFKERFSSRQWAGVAAFTAGLLLFFNQRLGGLVATSPDYITGLLTTALAAALWAAYGLSQKKLLASFLPRDILLLIYITGSLVFMPLATPTSIALLDTPQLLLLVFVSLNTIIAYGAFAQAMVVWEVSRVSAVVTLAPLMTMLFAQALWLLAPGQMALEPLNLLSWAGAIMVVAGSTVAALAGSSKKAS
jgi:drug/metabolite transporter (DMT)-like permease